VGGPQRRSGRGGEEENIPSRVIRFLYMLEMLIHEGVNYCFWYIDVKEKRLSVSKERSDNQNT